MKKFVIKFVGDDETVEVHTGRLSLWKSLDYGGELPDSPTKKYRTDFAWGYFAAEQAGMLDKLGIGGMDVNTAIEHLADNFDMEIGEEEPKVRPIDGQLAE